MNIFKLYTKLSILIFLFPVMAFSDKVSNGIFHYTIKKGNTLSFITEYFGISKDALLRYNSKNTVERFQKDDVLKIPLKQSVIQKYTIKKGDGVFAIEKKMGLNPNTLNQILDEASKSKFWEGTVIYIPNHSQKQPLKVKKEEVKKPLKKARPLPEEIYYKVQKGDSFYGIGKRFGLDIETLQKIYKKNVLGYDTTITIPTRLIKNKEGIEKYSAPPATIQIKEIKTSSSKENKSDTISKKLKPETLLAPIKQSSSYRFSQLSHGKFFKGAPTIRALFAPLSGEVTAFKPFFSFGKAIFYQTKNGTFIFASQGFQALNVSKNRLIEQGSKLTFIKPNHRVYVFLINNDQSVQPPW